MLLSSEYNKLAWAIRKKYDIPLKWAMKSAYCLRDMGKDNPELWLTKPRSPLYRIWDPANVMKLICVIRSQANLCKGSNRSKELNHTASLIYDKYASLEGIGCEFIATLLDGELVYWATKYYVDSHAAKKNGEDLTSRTLAIDLGEGDSYTTFWFDYLAS